MPAEHPDTVLLHRAATTLRDLSARVPIGKRWTSGTVQVPGGLADPTAVILNGPSAVLARIPAHGRMTARMCERTATYIATVDPTVTGALADLLDEVAAQHGPRVEGDCWCIDWDAAEDEVIPWPCPEAARALAVARAVCREEVDG